MKPIFIIEHLEPRVWRWCEIEYESISKIVDQVWFTNLARGSKPLEKYGKAKLRSKSMPNNLAVPSAISEYPEKSP